MDLSRFLMSLSQKYCNPQNFDVRGNLYFISDYELEESQKLVIPANTMIVIQVELSNDILNESMRFLFLGAPQRTFSNVDSPVRISQFSLRLPIQE